MKFSSATLTLTYCATLTTFTSGHRIGDHFRGDDNTVPATDLHLPTPSRKLGSTPVCKGDTLRKDERLYANEYLCYSTDPSIFHHRFGLDENGKLAFWDSNLIEWSPGVSGDFLVTQGDGNVVLYQHRDGTNEPVWATDCLSPGARLFLPWSYPRVLDTDDETVWKIDWNGQETTCNPTSTPQVKCRGNILGSTVRLYPNEYLCDTTGRVHRFGLNARGQLALWHHNSIMWTPGWNKRGDYVHEQADGNLVLYKVQGSGVNPLWATDCQDDGSILTLDNGGVKVTDPDDNIKWMVNSYGEESPDCSNPVVTTPSDCSSASPDGGICKMQMIDNLNIHYTVLSVTELGNGEYHVTDEEGNCDGEPWTEHAQVNDDGSIDIDAGVPEVTCDEMLEDYEMKDDSQLTFLNDPRHPCTPFGKSLIYFMVMEWFYFG